MDIGLLENLTKANTHALKELTGRGITEIWTGSVTSNTTIDWSGTGYTLSQFDAIMFVGHTLGTIAVPSWTSTITVPTSALFSLGSGAGAFKVAQFDGNTYTVLVGVVTDTSVDVSITTSSGGTTAFRGIYGINYK